MNTKSTIFTVILPFLVPTHLLLIPTPERTYFPSCSSFFFLSSILIVQGSFVLVLQAYIYHALIKLNPAHTYPFSITMLP
jgi:hypothetical protein